MTFDISKVTLGQDGVEGFLWPMPYPRLKDIHDRAIVSVARESRRASTGSIDDALALVSNFFLQEALAVCQAHFVGKSGTIDLPPSARLWAAAAAGRKAERSPYLDYLADGLQSQPKWKQLIRPAAGLIRKGPIRYSWPTKRVLKRSVVATTINEVERLRASAFDEKVVYAPIARWFPALEAAAIGAQRRVFRTAAGVEQYVTAVVEAFSKENVTLEVYETEYLTDYLIELASTIAAHVGRLSARPERLPARLWTGTGGILWSRMLRLAVRKSGGRAWGHDHAEGHGHYETDVRPFWEFFECNEFVTFNHTQVEAINKHLDKKILPTDHLPVVSSLSIAIPSPKPRSPSTTKVKRVLYAATVYPGERVLFPPLLQDMPAVDWQARLFSKLAEWGYEVILKPHPESRSPVPQQLREICCQVDERPFDEALEGADLVLFDLPQSTTFGTVLRTSMTPIVVVDLGMDRWDPDALRLAERRCSFVAGKFDRSGRVEVEWDSLKSAMERAPSLRDSEFTQVYLSYGT